MRINYWQEKGVVVSVVETTGKEQSVYYSQSDLVILAAIDYSLSVCLSVDVARETVKTLKEKEPEISKPISARRFML